jgi:hypothetical protein
MLVRSRQIPALGALPLFDSLSKGHPFTEVTLVAFGQLLELRAGLIIEFVGSVEDESEFLLEEDSIIVQLSLIDLRDGCLEPGLAIEQAVVLLLGECQHAVELGQA